MNTRKGFTLAELMVVVSIIALLGAILLPTLSSVFQTARTTVCANNLNRIGQCVQNRAADGQSWNLSYLAEAWVSTVNTYAGGRECLQCPEAELLGQTLQEGNPIEDQIAIKDGGSGVLVPLLPLSEGGGFKMLKLSNTQYQRLGECNTIEPIPYVPDDNPNVYWWCYDDGAIGTGDYDFQDITVRVTKNGDGTANLYIFGGSGLAHTLWRLDPLQQLCEARQVNTCYGATAGLNLPGFQVGGGSNYGMNNAALDVRRVGKLQALDYMNSTATAVDDWSSADWDKDGDRQPDFLRHRGRLNVLMTGGAVKPMWRDQVDPVNVDVDRELWEP